MSKTFTLLCFLLVCFFWSAFTPLSAQILLWPGDINNNGEVNGKDVLRWGYAYGATGLGRVDNGSIWAPLNLAIAWDKNFPGETNFAFADCDGSGEVSTSDVRNVIDKHFTSTHGTLTPDYCPVGSKNNAPELKLSASPESYTAGAKIDLQLSLGSNNRPLSDFYGLTFRLTFNRDMIKPGAVTYTPLEKGWYDITGNVSYSYMHHAKEEGVLEIAVVRTNQKGVDGFGVLGTLSLILRGNTDLVLPGALNLEIDLVQMINSDLEVLPVYYSSKIQIPVSGEGTVANCPDVIEPVCGSDGRTYINSCYAEAAGITEYTLGTCFSNCIDPDKINPEAVCAAEVAPVCGCNNVTYSNACLAEAAGVTNYFSGPCKTDTEDRACYDPILVVQSSGTTVDEATGVVNINCSNANEPVCGCNGITYRNACVAEASGIAFYTPGVCNTTCVDPQKMDPEAPCTNVYAPVCGCNGVTYSNPCAAGIAGVVSYSQGACGQSSNWCAEAIPIQCGDFLAQETTVGAGNQIAQYPSCNSNTFLGPDRIYVFEKTTPGDLQIGLEILTPGIDLDLFLLKGTCDEVVCIRSSTTNNQNTNNEGIILPDAPLGTYYIVVDAQYANIAGKFHLEVNCGYLYCGKAIELNCGEPFKYNNSNGADDVSLYTCGTNVYNVENNGPEVVHYFTTTTAGDVDIQLTGLSANLELFLLGECDRGQCMRYSQNPGTSSEQITTYLEPGTYYVVVDGYNGASSDYSLLVECENTCTLALTSVSTTPSTCGTNSGSIDITSSGGTPGYLVYYSGPLSGSFSTTANHCTIYYLPPGTYEIKKIDSKGCVAKETVTIYSSGSLDAEVKPFDAVCNEPGYLWVSIEKGQAPYKIYLSGPENAELNVAQSTFTLSDLNPGTYTLYIVDANGCSVTKKATIQKGESNFNFGLTPHPAGCGELGYVTVVTQNGKGPYTIILSGPVGGKASAQGNVFNIRKLPGGTYKLTLEDSNNCSFTESFTIGDINLELSTTVNNGICGQNGTIEVQVSNGAADYILKWTGPVSGMVITSSDTYLIPDLPSGSYQIEVEDAGLCTGYKVVEVNNTGGNLTTELSAIGGKCGAPGALLIDIKNGTGPYQVVWEGPVSGLLETDITNFNIPDLPEGLYKVGITDENGCSDEQSAYVNQEGKASITLTGYNGSCGQDGSIRLEVLEGQANYIINWEGPVSGSTTTSEKLYDITDLPSGNYKVAVTDANGCTANKVLEIKNAEGFLVFEPIVTPANCEQNGAITITVSGGEAAYELSWEGPVSGTGSTDTAGQLTIPDLPAGSYQMAAKDKNGCTGTTTVNVEAEDGNLRITLSAKDPICTQYGSIVVSIIDGSPEFSVSWEGTENGVSYTNASSFSIVNLPAGAYKVTVTDKFGCKAVDNVTLIPTGDLDISAQAVNAACGLGDIEISISKGTPIFKISWNGPAVGNTTTDNNSYIIPDLPDGVYKITVSDINGCTDQAEVKINSGAGPKIIATAKPGVCGANGAIGVSISGGTPDFALKWTGPQNGNTSLSSNYYEIPALPGGNYTILIIDSNGCEDQKVIGLSNETTDLALQTTVAESDCGQENIISVAISGGQADYTIAWSGPQNGSKTTNNLNYQIPDLAAGDYQVKVTDAKGCTAAGNITIKETIIDLLSLSAEPGICDQAGNIVVQIIGGNPTYTISWNGPVSGTTTTNAASATIPDLPSGSYSVALTDANGCSETELIKLENEISDLDLEVSTAANKCGQLYTALIDITGGQSPFAVAWSGTTNGSISMNERHLDLELAPGNYQVKVTDDKGCTTTESLSIIETAVELLTLSAEKGSCGTFGKILVQVSGGTPVYSLDWSGPTSGTTTTAGNSYAIPDLPGGQYSVTLTDANGCTDSGQINLQNTTPLEAKVVRHAGTCSDSPYIDINISNGSPGFAITWKGPKSGTITTTNTEYSIIDLLVGDYEITIIDAKGCKLSETIELEGIDSHLKIEAEGHNGTCGDGGSIDLTMNGGRPDYLISWDGPVAGSESTDQNTSSLSALPSGTYSISITDANGCQEVALVTLENEAAVDVALKGVSGTCGGLGSIRVDYFGEPPFLIAWSGPSNGSEGVNTDFYNIPNLVSGVYQVKITSSNDCEYTESIQIQTIENDLSFETLSEDRACDQPGAITVNISGGQAAYTIAWSGPQNGSKTTNSLNYQIPGLAAGDYQVKVTDARGCTAAGSVTIKEAVIDDLFSLSTEPVICEQAGNIIVQIIGGNPTYTISWNGPVSGTTTTNGASATIPDLPSGNYSVTLTDTNGCTETELITLENEISDLDLQVSAAANLCGQYYAALIDITGGQAPFAVEWSGAANGSISMTGKHLDVELSPGDYEIKVTDDKGCTTTASLSIIEAEVELLKLSIEKGSCGNPGKILVQINGGTPIYTLDWSGPESGSTTTVSSSYAIPDLPAGQYSVTLTDANGCTDSGQISLQSTTPLDVSVLGHAGTCTDSPYIDINIHSGTPGFAISWEGPKSGNTTTTNTEYTIPDLIAGTYKITFTDAKGCTQSETLELEGVDSHLKIDAKGRNGTCGNSGKIDLALSGGSPDYLINWAGPASGSETTDQGAFSITQLPAGTYSISISDSNGCEEVADVTLENEGTVDVTLKKVAGTCGGLGSIRVDYSGEPPFLVTWSGPSNGSVGVNTDFYNIPDLISGVYEVTITSSNDCQYQESIQIQTIENDLSFELLTDGGGCDQPGSITVNISGGTPNYLIKWNSVNAKGSATITNNSFTIPELPDGIYDITVSDNFACKQEKQVQLVNHNNTVSFSSSVVHPSCENTKGSITLAIDGDFPDFTITWTGPASGTATSGKGTYTIPDLNKGTYIVVVSDANGCSEKETLTLNDHTGTPNAFFTYTTDKLTTSFTHTGATGTYLWDFGDGNTSTEADPVYEFGQSGTYLVCLTLTNGCGSAKYCTNISLGTPDDLVLLDVGEKIASVAATVKIPVTVEHLSLLVSLSGSLEITDPTVAQIKGLLPGKITPQYNGQNKTFIYYHTGGQGIALQEKDILFYIELQVIGSPGQSSDIRLSDKPLKVEVGSLENGLAVIKPHFSQKGSITIAASAGIAGQVTTYWGDPIPDAEVQVSGADLKASQMTDAVGHFTVPDLELGQEYTIKPYKDVFPFNGLSTHSLFIGQRFILGKDPIQITSPYQIIAGDANCNGSFTTLDLYIIQQLIIGATDKFNYCPSWVFVSGENQMPEDFDAYNVFPYYDYQKLVVETDTVTNFIGVKVGDILGQANPEAFTTTPGIEVRNPVYLDLQAANRTLRRGEELELQITSDEFWDMVSYQFSLDFDPTALAFTAFQGGAAGDLAGVVAGTRLAERGQLALSWFSKKGQGIHADAEEQLFTLKFEALRDIDELQGLIAVKDLPLSAEAYTGSGERYKVRLNWADESGAGAGSEWRPFRLYQNIPNPAKKQSEIRFDLPQAYSGELTLHDNLGQIVYRQAGDFIAGNNRLVLPVDYLQAGVYYYTLKAGPHTASRSMVVVK